MTYGDPSTDKLALDVRQDLRELERRINEQAQQREQAGRNVQTAIETLTRAIMHLIDNEPARARQEAWRMRSIGPFA